MAQNNDEKENYQFFKDMAGEKLNLTESVYSDLIKVGNGDVNKMADHLMNWTMDDPAMKAVMEAERKRKREEDAKKMADFEEKRKREEEVIRSQQEVLMRAQKEREAELKKKQEELSRKKAEEDEVKRRQEEQKRAESARKFAEEARKFAEAEEAVRKRLLESQIKKDQQKGKEDQERKKKEELEVKRKIKEEEEKRKEFEIAKRVAEELAKKKEEEEKKQQEEAAEKKKQEEMLAAAAAAAAAMEAKKKEEEKKKSVQSQKDQEEYEKRFSLLEARLIEFEKAQKDKKEEETPKVCILTENTTPQEQVDAIINFLVSKGVKPNEVRVVNGSNDYELNAVVKGQRETLLYPSILIHSVSIGTFEDLKKCSEKIGVLDALLAGEKIDMSNINNKKPGDQPTPPELKLGIYDYGITLGEYTLKTVFFPIVGPYKLLSWAFGGKQPELPPGEEIDVMQSNWYWRHQLRTIRFTTDSIIRIRPGYNDVRAMYKYDDVKEIKLLDPTYLVITYRAGSADYLRATPTDVKRICEIICMKNKNVPPPKST